MPYSLGLAVCLLAINSVVSFRISKTGFNRNGFLSLHMESDSKKYDLVKKGNQVKISFEVAGKPMSFETGN